MAKAINKDNKKNGIAAIAFFLTKATPVFNLLSPKEPKKPAASKKTALTKQQKEARHERDLAYYRDLC